MFRAVAKKLKQISSKSLVRNAVWELLAKLVTLTVQAAYFIILTRTLGAKNYGFFVGVASLAALVYPFSTLGSGELLVQQVARQKRTFPLYWGNGLLIVSVSSLILTILLFLISPIIFTDYINYLAVLTILIADLTCLALFYTSARAFMAVSLFRYSSLLQIISAVTKLIATLILAFCFPTPTLLNWTWLYLASAVITVVVGVVWVSWLLGKPKVSITEIKPMISQGIYFSIGESAYNINSHIDKAMLASMASLKATGIYGAAYRFIQVGSVPLYGLMAASYPQFFQQGKAGIKGCLVLARRLLPILGLYGVIALCGCYFFAPWIPYILGEEYQSAVAALRWLAPIPVLGAMQLLLADSLTGAGFQKTRSTIEVVTAAGNALLNFWLIPLYSWQGATWATLGSDSFRVICLLVAVVFFYYQQKKRELLK